MASAPRSRECTVSLATKTQGLPIARLRLLRLYNLPKQHHELGPSVQENYFVEDISHANHNPLQIMATPSEPKYTSFSYVVLSTMVAMLSFYVRCILEDGS